MVSSLMNFRHLQSGLGLIPTGHPDPNCSTTQSPSIGDGPGRVDISGPKALSREIGSEITCVWSTGGSRIICNSLVHDVPQSSLPQAASTPMYSYCHNARASHVLFFIFWSARWNNLWQIPECEVRAPQADASLPPRAPLLLAQGKPGSDPVKTLSVVLVCAVRKTGPESFSEKPHSVSSDCSPASPCVRCDPT